MFKSISEYDKSIYKVLVHVRDNNSFPKPDDLLNSNDLGDVVNLCNNRGYIDGIEVMQNIKKHYMSTGTPRITYSGLKFIENFNQ